MANNRIVFAGLNELKAALRSLPAEDDDVDEDEFKAMFATLHVKALEYGYVLDDGGAVDALGSNLLVAS